MMQWEGGEGLSAREWGELRHPRFTFNKVYLEECIENKILSVL